MQNVDVVVVGAGLAGLHTARRLAEQDLAVLVVDRRRSLSAGIRTTGIFVRRTLDDFDVPAHLLGPGVRDVLLYPPSRRAPVHLTSDRDEYRVADMPGVYAHARRAAEGAGARVRLGVRYTGTAGGVVTFADAEPVRARFVVGADGARSRVARDLGLDVNRRLIVGAELIHPVAAGPDAPAFHCVLDPRVAPGYLGWVIDDGRHAHVGVAGYPAAMRAGVRQLLDVFAADAPGRPAAAGPVERRGGPIPVGGVLRRLACPAGLLVGDAAGAVSPLTAGGLDPCLRMSDLAAAVTAGYLRSGDEEVLRRYDGGALRARFRGRLLLRRMFAGLRSPAAVEAAVAALRGRTGRAAAARVLFGDGSFPDVDPRPARFAVR
ncbi:NAD(P)/FAD-dependent oxidoreductase [Dactylosporangium aurantiacum]|uniref:NAD(P)/FAD-dependent oxidoreductase n=1 Tax=Dactylosporangium aurantiacum TaxID=35754 RepID=A0A9Q9MQY3_9ACTN|nr:NAD(P)/FAD-dependent oxidoreductase [Dactylosporangium aurantiacum]MDG6105797.1 NAD(P)/FAD-dependent oxidoreductase [Dactylosporangium aurantiacum]UWZ58017.1 NAD(P)/FAD-dependent oxidoreductase [Dactylosporangium aurantiacum]